MAQYTKLCIRAFTCGLVLLTFGCATPPSEFFANKAQNYGFTQKTVSTTQFDLTAFTNAAFQKSSDDQRLHIYLGGDGQPFFRNHYINPDPTSKRALTLELMSLDGAPSIYIGRPCYHNVDTGRKARTCDDTKWWTSHRYSEEIVDSLTQAIVSVLKIRSNAQTKLIGFSGGGTLAILLAARIEESLESVITINPNLNIDAWTDHHGYTPLNGSINPHTQADLPRQMVKHYLLGDQDSNVLAKDWLGRFEHQKNSHLHRFEKVDHTCCWPKIWERFLQDPLEKP